MSKKECLKGKKSPKMRPIARMAPVKSHPFTIILPDGETFIYECATNAKVKQLYEAVSLKLGINQKGLCCYHNGVYLRTGTRLDEYDIEDEDVIDCLLIEEEEEEEET